MFKHARNIQQAFKEDAHFYGKLFAIALPIAFQNLITSVVNMMDVFMISNLSSEAIAGVGIANKLFFLLNLYLFGTASGSAILTAQYWGAKDTKNIHKVLGIGITLGLIGSSVFAFLSIFTPAFVMGIFTSDAGVIAEGVKFLRIIGVSYGITSVTFAYVFILRSTGNVKLPMTISVITIILNTVLNYMLIYGHFGAPRLEVSGSALATVIARVIECTLLLSIVYIKKLPAAGSLKEMFGYTPAFFMKYIKIVLPVISNELIWALGVTMYAIVYGHMGRDVMAAMTITQTIEQFAFIFIFGIGNAAGVILGNAIGAGEEETVFQYAKKLLRISVIVGVVMGLMVFLASPAMINIFNVEQAVKVNIRNCLIVFSFLMTFKAVNLVVIVGILRSGGDTIFTMLIDSGSVWLVAVPLAFLGAFYFHLDVVYVYLLVMMEEVVKIIFGLYRTYSKKWIRNVVHENA